MCRPTVAPGRGEQRTVAPTGLAIDDSHDAPANGVRQIGQWWDKLPRNWSSIGDSQDAPARYERVKGRLVQQR
jgi:hypothetical protein